MFHQRFPKLLFFSVVGPSNISTFSFWLFPFLNGDQELVLHKNSALTNELVRNVLRREGFATSFDGIDVVLYTLLQLFARAALCPAVYRRRFSRFEGLKEERSIR